MLAGVRPDDLAALWQDTDNDGERAWAVLTAYVRATAVIAAMLDAWAVNVSGAAFWSEPFNVPFLVAIGATALLLEQASPPHLLQGIREFGATVCFTAPVPRRASSARARRSAGTAHTTAITSVPGSPGRAGS